MPKVLNENCYDAVLDLCQELKINVDTVHRSELDRVHRVGKSNFAEDVAVNQSQNVEGANKSQNTDPAYDCETNWAPNETKIHKGKTKIKT